MDFAFTKKEADFYREVDSFIRKELPADWFAHNLFWPGGYGSVELKDEASEKIAKAFHRKLVEKGWYAMAWPKEYGGKGCTYMEQAIFDERTSYYRVFNYDVISAGIVAPTILKYGSEAQKKEWIPRIGSGEITMWLGYSEPNAGSDLAALQTTAVEDGDAYVINGQKVWSSLAHVSDYAWLIARTDPTAKKHDGLSYFIVDNKTPGITIRPIVNALGIHHFNEVFFENVRVPKKNLIGEKNKGFYHLMTALDFERVVLVGIGGFKRFHEELLKVVKKTTRDGKPLGSIEAVRKRLAWLATRIEIGYLLVWKTAGLLDKGRNATVEAAALKVMATELSRELAEAAMEILGPSGLLEAESKWSVFGGMAARGFVDCISATIGAGASEIQRNIIATRGLGLPRA